MTKHPCDVPNTQEYRCIAGHIVGPCDDTRCGGLCTSLYPCGCVCHLAAYDALKLDGVTPDTAVEALDRAREQGLNLDKFAEFAVTVRRLAEKSEGNREALRLAGNSAAFDALISQFNDPPSG